MSNISTCEENNFFQTSLKKYFLLICQKISTFRGKRCFLEIILKKSFFAHISEKSTFEENYFFQISLKKNFFFPKYQKISTFRAKGRYCQISVEKNHYLPKCQHFEKNYVFLIILLRPFPAHISEIISIRKENDFFRYL